MRQLGQATIDHARATDGIVAHLLLWVTAKDRATGQPATMGLWTGDDVQDFVIDGQTRSYFGAGSFIDGDPVTMETGLKVRMHRVRFAPVTAEAAQLVRGYDTRLAPVELHRALFDPVTMTLIDTPHRLVRGWINSLPIPTPAEGQTAAGEMIIASSARALTKSLSRTFSDGSLRARAPADGFFKYTDITGEVETRWGA